jgi:hypothetical protein
VAICRTLGLARAAFAEARKQRQQCMGNVVPLAERKQNEK